MPFSDLEITKRCAEAMGYRIQGEFPHETSAIKLIDDDISPVPSVYNPLVSDAQAMALEDLLIANGYLHYEDGKHMFYSWPLESGANTFSRVFDNKAERRRLVCECVANLSESGRDK